MVHSTFHFILLHFLLINVSRTSPKPSIGNNIKQKNEKIPKYMVHLEGLSLEPFIKHKPLFFKECISLICSFFWTPYRLLGLVLKLFFSVGSNRKIPNLEPPEPLVNRTSNLPNLFLDFKTEPNLKRPNLEPLLILKKWLF